MKHSDNENMTEALPHAIENIDEVFKVVGTRKPVLFLDFDGTLSPIVAHADDAMLPDKNKEIIIALAKIITVSLISGRDRKDLKSKVNLESLIYAGSHGFDITGPDNLEMQYEPGQKALPLLDLAEKRLQEKLENVEGSKVERKKYAIAVHYRNVADEKVAKVERIVQEELDQQKDLKKGTGKKVLELKPNLDWHKGRALQWLMNKLNFISEEYVPIFIGDDVTDEDALKIIKEDGIGIIVGSHDQKTAASFRLEDTDEVTEFLVHLHNRLKQGLHNEIN
ncbi:MAG: trehalose-phosphatase [Bacteroidota bacterium]|nr:trehalose-phosphatase [Bacteroidota bacterium]